MELIETSIFTRQIHALLSDDEYGEFQSRIAANPELGSLIKGGGIRKIRVAIGSRGKTGGARVIYYWAVRSDGGSDSETNFAARKGRQEGVCH